MTRARSTPREVSFGPPQGFRVQVRLRVQVRMQVYHALAGTPRGCRSQVMVARASRSAKVWLVTRIGPTGQLQLAESGGPSGRASAWRQVGVPKNHT